MSIIKKLPKIYQNNIDKKFKNNKEFFYSFAPKEENISMSTSDVLLILDGIFNAEIPTYSIPVVIGTNNKVYDTYLVARTSSFILTIDRDKIRIEDIIYIQRKNP